MKALSAADVSQTHSIFTIPVHLAVCLVSVWALRSTVPAARGPELRFDLSSLLLAVFSIFTAHFSDSHRLISPMVVCQCFCVSRQ